jgi:hypothetical protein
MKVLKTVEGQCERVLVSWSKFSEFCLVLKYPESLPEAYRSGISYPFGAVSAEKSIEYVCFSLDII